MSNFTMSAWREYCAEHVRPQHEHDGGQLARFDCLLKGTDVALAWRKLARDVTRNWPEHLEPLSWQEALHNVIGAIVFPPGVIDKREYVRPFVRPAHLPLMPATTKGTNAQRNWVALYVRTRIIPAFFNKKHYEEIAVLVNAAWGDGNDEFTANNVGKLRGFHFRKQRK